MKEALIIIGVVLLSLSLVGFAHDKTYKASWYGYRFHGKLTASGEVYDMYDFTCAATSDYEFGEMLEVTNVNNGKKVIVKVNDRGAFAKYGRTLDLSQKSFETLAPLNEGVIKVKIKRLKKERK